MLWPLALLASGGLLSSGLALEVPQYQVGEVATNTVVTPVALTVRDPAATTLLRAQEAADIPSILRYAPSVVDEVERTFRAHMKLVREEFLTELEAVYSPRQIEAGPKPTAKWHELTARFQEEHKGCPDLARYLPYWALGQSDEHLLSNWVDHLRGAMGGPIRSDDLAAGDLGSSVCLVTLPSLETEVGLLHAERHGVLTPADRIVSVSSAARGLASRFPEQDRSLVEFIDRFLRPNCLLDAELTRLARRGRLQSLSLAHDYAVGQTLVREGQVIDANAVAALNALRARTSNVPGPPAPEPAAPHDQVALPEGPVVHADAAAAPQESEGGAGNGFGPIAAAPERGTPRDGIVLRAWLFGVVGGMSVLLAAILLARRGATGRSRNRFMARIPSAALPAPVRMGDGTVTVAPGAAMGGEAERDWRLRALEAENKAEKAMELARANVANALKDEVVERLSAQHYELVDHLHSATEQMAGLEQRLERIHGPLSERLRAYEQRIAELERDLASRDEESRALIRALIHGIRVRMAREKAGRGPQRLDLESDLAWVRPGGVDEN